MGQLKATNAKARAAEEKSQNQPRLAGTEAKGEMMGDMPKTKFEKLLDGIENAEQRKDDGAMSMASAAKAFKDAGGNYDALKLVRKLADASPEKRKDFLRHFDIYGDHYELRADTGDLFKDDKATKDQALKPLDALKSKEDTKEEQGAYEAGIASCKFGRDRDSNPHDAEKKPKEHAAFDRGWVAAFEGGQKDTLKEGGGEESANQSGSADNVTSLPQKPNGGDAKASATDGKA
ncbi:MAG: hypothetical protein AXW12_00585 [Thalassospira sp. Nap_22]|nr:MAG: hypothetical protein AXW12_00585 [Thalassospira sp. Nap_22]